MRSKYLVYLLTFLGYIPIHAMRMSYSFTKPFFKERFGLSNFYMGSVDAAIYISLGIGFLMRFIISGKMNVVKAYYIFTTVSALMFIVMPTISLLDLGSIFAENNGSFLLKTIIFFSLTLFGFFQLSAYPVSLLLVNDYFNTRDDGALLGFWPTSADFGNIFGFLFSSIIVFSLNFRWEIALLLFGGSSLFTSLLILFCLKPKSEEEKEEQQQFAIQYEEEQMRQSHKSEITCTQFFQYIKQKTSSLKTVIFLTQFCLYKAILYGFLLWIPTFLVSLGYKNISGYVPIIMNVSTIIGSVLIGKIYAVDKNHQKSERYQSEDPSHISIYFMFYISLIVIVTFICFNIIHCNLVIYMILTGTAGLSIGGIFNILASNQTIAFAEGKPENVSMLITLIMAIGNIFTGILEIIIGKVVGESSSNESSGYQKIFIVLLATSCIGTVLILIRSRMKSLAYAQNLSKKI